MFLEMLLICAFVFDKSVPGWLWIVCIIDLVLTGIIRSKRDSKENTWRVQILNILKS